MVKVRSRPVTTFRTLGVDDLRNPAAAALFVEHWNEIALNKGVMKLDPHWRKYYELEERGALLILGAFVGDALAGYSVNIITEHLHYCELVCCYNDLLFVSAQYRHSSVGRCLIEATVNDARARGAKLMLWHVKQGTTLDTWLPRMGYGVQDIIYSKEL